MTEKLGHISVAVYDADRVPQRERVFKMPRQNLDFGQLLMMSNRGQDYQIDVTLQYTGTFEVAVPRFTFGPLYSNMLAYLRKLMRDAVTRIHGLDCPSKASYMLQLVDGEQNDGVRGDMFVCCTDVYSSRPVEVLAAMKELEVVNFRVGDHSFEK